MKELRDGPASFTKSLLSATRLFFFDPFSFLAFFRIMVGAYVSLINSNDSNSNAPTPIAMTQNIQRQPFAAVRMPPMIGPTVGPMIGGIEASDMASPRSSGAKTSPMIAGPSVVMTTERPFKKRNATSIPRLVLRAPPIEKMM